MRGWGIKACSAVSKVEVRRRFVWKTENVRLARRWGSRELAGLIRVREGVKSWESRVRDEGRCMGEILLRVISIDGRLVKQFKEGS